MATSTTSDPRYNQLLRETKQREDFIKRIKNEVSQNTDNIKRPVPLFQQLLRRS